MADTTREDQLVVEVIDEGDPSLREVQLVVEVVEQNTPLPSNNIIFMVI